MERDYDIRYLWGMYPTKAKRINFLAKCALTFSLDLDSLSEVTGLDKDKLYTDLLNFYEGNRSSLMYLFKHNFFNQDATKANFINYFRRLTAAYLNKDKKAISLILLEISDKEAIDAKEEIQINKAKYGNNVPFTEEQILAILKYQLKYGLSGYAISRIFVIDRTKYYSKVLELEDKYPQLLSQYHYLTDALHKSGRKGLK